MPIHLRIGCVSALLLIAGTTMALAADVPTADATGFVGTWTFAMTNPPNSDSTVRISDQGGRLAATFQVGRFPPTAVTGIFKDGDMLVLTTTVRENGIAIWTVIALTREGETMQLAQMLQNSQTIKRGTGRKQG